MKHLIVQFLEKGTIALLAIILIVAFISGYNANGLGAAILGIIIAFVFSVPFFGFLFLLLEMNESLSAIRKALESKQ